MTDSSQPSSEPIIDAQFEEEPDASQHGIDNGYVVEPEDARWAMLTHLSALLGLFVPNIAGFVGPLILWLLRRDAYRFTRDQGKDAINFQLSMLVYTWVGTLVLFVTIIASCLIPVWAGALWLLNVVLVIVAGMEAKNGCAFRYPLTIRFLR